MAYNTKEVTTMGDLNLDTLCFVNFTNLQNVLMQIATAVRQNAVDIQVLQDGLNLFQEEATNKKMADRMIFQEIRTDIDKMKESMKTLASGVDILDLKFSLEQKNKILEDQISKMKLDATTLQEEVTGLTGETIDHATQIQGMKKDVDKFKNETSNTFQSLEGKADNLDAKVRNCSLFSALFFLFSLLFSLFPNPPH
jgi:predicted  nucleic acid-binding Zn-ribbon protein